MDFQTRESVLLSRVENFWAIFKFVSVCAAHPGRYTCPGAVFAPCPVHTHKTTACNELPVGAYTISAADVHQSTVMIDGSFDTEVERCTICSISGSRAAGAHRVG